MKFLLFLLFIVFSKDSFGQQDSLKDDLLKDSLKIVKVSNKPRTAFLLGATIPSGGQAFNKRLWKMPFALAAYGFIGYNFIQKQNRFKEFSGYFETALKENKKIEVRPGLSFDAKQLKFYRDKFRDQRDVAIFMGIGIHLIVALEAYVDAHLKGFDISENLSLISSSHSMGLGIAYKLH